MTLALIRRRALRRNSTEAEVLLWSCLRAKRFAGFKFRRQQPIGPYIADFVCFEAGLVIELDGDQHGSDDSVAYDERRTLFLQKVGFDVIRFPNREVNNSLDNVLDAIAHHLKI